MNKPLKYPADPADRVGHPRNSSPDWRRGSARDQRVRQGLARVARLRDPGLEVEPRH